MDRCKKEKQVLELGFESLPQLSKATLTANTYWQPAHTVGYSRVIWPQNNTTILLLWHLWQIPQLQRLKSCDLLLIQEDRPRMNQRRNESTRIQLPFYNSLDICGSETHNSCGALLIYSDTSCTWLCLVAHLMSSNLAGPAWLLLSCIYSWVSIWQWFIADSVKVWSLNYCWPMSKLIKYHIFNEPNSFTEVSWGEGGGARCQCAGRWVSSLKQFDNKRFWLWMKYLFCCGFVVVIQKPCGAWDETETCRFEARRYYTDIWAEMSE